MKVAELIGTALVAAGVDHVFGVAGSSNFHINVAMVEHGATYVSARHESGATSMADAFARCTGGVGVVSVHQGPGLTNAFTAIIESVKANTPLVVLAPSTPMPTQTSKQAANFWLEQEELLRTVGCSFVTARTAEEAVQAAHAAIWTARRERTVVVLGVPTDVLDMQIGPEEAAAALGSPSEAADPEVTQDRVALADDVQRVISRLSESERPVFILGRGAIQASTSIQAVADSVGALIATSAAATGLLGQDRWNLGISGGFSTPIAASLIADADLIVAWGASLNRWTTADGELVPGTRKVVQIDDRESAIGAYVDVDVPVIGDTQLVAELIAASWTPDGKPRYRTPEVQQRLEQGRTWREVEFDDTSTDDRIDPRSLTIALDRILPRERTVVSDNGNFCPYPIAMLSVPDQQGFCFPSAFMSIGLAMGAGVGAAVARPDRLAVVTAGDGGFTMNMVELETAARLELPLVVVVYNDQMYGAEVHRYGARGLRLETVEFPGTDCAAIARGFGCDAITVRALSDLAGLEDWLASTPRRPLLVDARITAFPSWVIEHNLANEARRSQLAATI